MTKLQQTSSEVYQMKVGRCVPVLVQIHYFILGVRCRVKNIQQSWVWSCEAIGRNLITTSALHSDPRVIVTS